VYNGKNACFDWSTPEQPDHLSLLNANTVRWSTKIGGVWSIWSAYPPSDKTTFWINPKTQSADKMVSVMPAMGNAVMTVEKK